MRLFLNIDKTKKGGVKLNDYAEVDVTSDDNIYLTHTFDSLESPVDYCAEYSYEVKLPRTKKNNQLFDHFYRLDNFISRNSFDPNIKLDYYVLSDHADILSRGVCFLNYVDDEYYHFNLLGSLNDIFTRLLNSGWDEQKFVEDDDYFFLTDYLKYNGQNYNNTPKLNRNTVFASWEIDPTEHIFSLEDLQNKYNELALMHLNLTPNQVYLANLVGFAPTNQGRYKNFQSNKWFKNINGRNQLVNVLASDNTTEYNLVGDGLTEAQIGEYRSYMQQPYIYVKRLLQIYKESCKTITGYDMRFDPSWYNDENLITNQLIYMLPQMYSDATETIVSNTVTDSENETMMPSFNSYSEVDNKVQNLNTFQTKYESDFQRLNANNYTYSANIQINLRMDSGRTVAPYPIKYNFNNPILLSGYLSDNTDVLVQKIIVVVPLTNTKVDGQYEETLLNTIGQDAIDRYMTFADEVVEVRYTPYTGGHNFILGDIDFSMDYISDGTKNVKFGYVANFGNTISPFSNESGQALNGSFTFNYLQYGRFYLNLKATNYFQEKTDGRSNQNLTMSTLFKTISPFEIILKFTKLTGKLWIVDDYSKTITIWDRTTYFQTILETDTNSKVPPVGDVSFAGVYNITSLIDKSKGMKLSAPSWSDKFLKFNYKELDADYFTDYRKKYNLQYGEKKIVTTNQKNNNTHNLFCRSEYDEIYPSMIASEYILKVKNIKANDADIKIENYPQVVNSRDNESANIWNNFYLRNKNGKFDKNIGEGWRPNYVLITDDMAEEKNGNYAWHSDETNAIKAYNRPRFNTHTWGDEVSIQFAPSREIYHQYEYLPTTKYLYENFRNYIEQVYNFQSKKVELYAHINSMLYRRLKQNPFVQVENSCFLVTKIEDWNENKNSVKITIIQIQNLNTLTDGKLIQVIGDLLAWDDANLITFDNVDKILV